MKLSTRSIQTAARPRSVDFLRDKRPEVMAAFAAAEIQTRMIERAHQGGSGPAGDHSGLLKIGP